MAAHVCSIFRRVISHQVRARSASDSSASRVMSFPFPVNVANASSAPTERMFESVAITFKGYDRDRRVRSAAACSSLRTNRLDNSGTYADVAELPTLLA